MDRKLVALLVVAAGLAFWLWDTWAVYPLKLFVVLFHESGHALAAWLVGGSVESIAIDPHQGGLTYTRHSGSFLDRVVISSGGYVGSTLFGAGILAVSARLRSGRAVLWGLAAFLVAALVLWVRDLFTAVFTLGMAATLALLGRVLAADVSRAAALFLGTFTGMYALWDIRDDLFTFGRTCPTDAAMLADATGIPALGWAIAWGLVSVAALVLAVRSATRRAKAPRTAPLPPSLG